MKKGKKFFWQIYPLQLFIILCAILFISTFVSISFRDFYYNETYKTLEDKTSLLKGRFVELLAQSKWQDLTALCSQLSEVPHTRFTLMDTKGEVLCDTDKESLQPANHALREEVRMALKGKVGQSLRFSDSLKSELLYFATPLNSPDGQLLGVLRASVPLGSLLQALQDMYGKILIQVLGITILFALVSWWPSRKISDHLETLKDHALKFSQGSFEEKIRLEDIDTEEFQQLGAALNETARQLHWRIRTILKQNNEQEAVFSSMREGVMSLKRSGYIIHLNQAASELLDLDTSKNYEGTLYSTLIKYPEIIQMVEHTLKTGASQEKELNLPSTPKHAGQEARDKIVNIRCAPLKRADQNKIGALLVFNDNTRIRELEGLRKAFVANVSHELRTPLTSIQGYLETLMDGKVDNQETQQRFLSIVKKHTDRLHTIIEDLLMLSQIERNTEHNEIALLPKQLKPIVESAISLCHSKANKKNVVFDVSIPEQLEIKANKNLLEQAIVNLIDNAIKYGPADSCIQIHTQLQSPWVKVHVTDQGSGIPAEHLPKIFERFYSVDRARSRQLGGTGLGLSIVKHIALAHGGQASVESQPGKGSTFSLQLYLA